MWGEEWRWGEEWEGAISLCSQMGARRNAMNFPAGIYIFQHHNHHTKQNSTFVQYYTIVHCVNVRNDSRQNVTELPITIHGCYYYASWKAQYIGQECSAKSAKKVRIKPR